MPILIQTEDGILQSEQESFTFFSPAGILFNSFLHNILI